MEGLCGDGVSFAERASRVPRYAELVSIDCVPEAVVPDGAGSTGLTGLRAGVAVGREEREEDVRIVADAQSPAVPLA